MMLLWTAVASATTMGRHALPVDDGTELFAFESVAEQPYEVVLTAHHIPASDHSWKAQVKGHLTDPSGQVHDFAGSPRRYKRRHSDGNGSHYWTELVLEDVVAEEDGFWTVTLDQGYFENPPKSLKLVVRTRRGRRGRETSSSSDGNGGFACFGALVILLGFVSRMYGSSGDGFSSCGGGCGGGCGGCGGCGG